MLLRYFSAERWRGHLPIPSSIAKRRSGDNSKERGSFCTHSRLGEVPRDGGRATLAAEGPMWCADPFLSMLKAFGYSVVRLPRADLAPLRLLARLGRDLEELGPVEAVLMPGPHVTAPRVARGRPSPALSGLHSANLDAGLGLSLLASLLASLGGSPQAVHAAWRRARRVSFAFDAVCEDSVTLVDLDQYLADARVNRRATQISRLLESDDLYVTTSVVKSRAFIVSATDDSGAGIELDVPAVGTLAGAAVEVSASHSGDCAVRFEGREALGFGFRAVRLFYDGGRYTAFRPLAPGDLALARPAPAPEWYESDAPFVRMEAGSGGAGSLACGGSGFEACCR